MQFVILKDDYCMDKYGIELNSKKPSGFKDYFLTGEYNRRSLSPSHNITHIDETEVPEDARNALKTVYSAWKKYSSADAGQSKELLSKLEKEYEDALKMLREFSCKDEISLSEFVQEFLKQLPDEVRNEIQENGYKVTTDFSDADFSCFDEYDEISCKNLKIARSKVATDDKDAVETCDIEYSKKITYKEDIAALKLRIQLFETFSKPLSVSWKGESYIKKSPKAGNPVMTVYNEYVIPFSEILTKAYAKMLATLFLTTDGSMKRWAVNVSSEKIKLHKKTYSIQ